MTAATKKAPSKKPAAKPAAKKPAPKPNERTTIQPGDFHITKPPEPKPEGKKEPALRPMHEAFVNALKAGAKAYGTVDKNGDFGGWVTTKNGQGKAIRVSHRLCAHLLKEVSRKDRLVEYVLA